MASSPPAWNAEIPAPRDRSEGESDMESDDDDDLDIQDIPNAHFDVLDTSRSTGELSLNGLVADDRTTNAASGCHCPKRPGEQHIPNPIQPSLTFWSCRLTTSSKISRITRYEQAILHSCRGCTYHSD